MRKCIIRSNKPKRTISNIIKNAIPSAMDLSIESSRMAYVPLKSTIWIGYDFNEDWLQQMPVGYLQKNNAQVFAMCDESYRIAFQ